MKRLLLVLAVVLCASSVDAGEWVRGYMRSNGTYVYPHYRSSPNSSIYDNYGYRPSQSYYTPSYRNYYTPSYPTFYPSYAPLGSQPYSGTYSGVPIGGSPNPYRY